MYKVIQNPSEHSLMHKHIEKEFDSYNEAEKCLIDWALMYSDNISIDEKGNLLENGIIIYSQYDRSLLLGDISISIHRNNENEFDSIYFIKFTDKVEYWGNEEKALYSLEPRFINEYIETHNVKNYDKYKRPIELSERKSNNPYSEYMQLYRCKAQLRIKC